MPLPFPFADTTGLLPGKAYVVDDWSEGVVFSLLVSVFNTKLLIGSPLPEKYTLPFQYGGVLKLRAKDVVFAGTPTALGIDWIIWQSQLELKCPILLRLTT